MILKNDSWDTLVDDLTCTLCNRNCKHSMKSKDCKKCEKCKDDGNNWCEIYKIF